LALKVLRTTTLDDADLGFQAFYDRTNFVSFQKICRRVGFNTIYYLPGFFSSFYFEFFVPLFVLSYLYDVARFMIGNPRIASYHLWVLQKPGAPVEQGAPRFYAWR
jgi:hypothetical protein